MSSQIDVTKPTTGTATTQSVRDNFSAGVSDIEALQGEASIRSIAATVASNALTVALKTSAGIDATASTGVEISFRNATATTGTRTTVSTEAAISVIVPQGATLGYANAATDNLYIYALNNAGTVEVGISAALFDEGTLKSSTAISATADSTTVLYSTTARTNIPIRLLGRVTIATGATAGDWSAAPTEIHSASNFHLIIGQDVQSYAISAATKVTADAALPKAGGEMTGDTTHGDDVKAKFGADDDLQIYHDGSHSHIRDVGTGNLIIRGSSGTYIQGVNGENCIIALEDSSVNLYHNNILKLATTSTGIDVTGTITVDGTGTSVFSGGQYIKVDGDAADVQDLEPVLWARSKIGASIAQLNIKGSSWQFGNSGTLDTAPVMVVDTGTGKVGIGTSSPASTLDVAGDINITASDYGRLGYTRGSTKIWTTGPRTSDDYHIYKEAGAGNIILDSAVFIGRTDGIYQLDLESTGTGMRTNRQGSDGQVHIFTRNDVQVGNISVTGSATSYNTSSDYRLKENVTPIVGATGRTKLLNAVNFGWIASGKYTDGFIAHQLAEIVPEAVTGTKDAMRDEAYEVTPATGDVFTAGSEEGFTEVSPAIAASPAYYDVDGNVIKVEVIAKAAVHEAYEAIVEVIHSADVEQPETLEEGQQWRETTAKFMATRSVPDMQGIDQAKLVPLLTATIQELIARIEILEA
jgi:hypothetical protein